MCVSVGLSVIPLWRLLWCTDAAPDPAVGHHGPQRCDSYALPHPFPQYPPQFQNVPLFVCSFVATPDPAISLHGPQGCDPSVLHPPPTSKIPARSGSATYLQTVVHCRPAYMDEFEKLEEELQQVYDDYMLKFRNQAYLENILDEYHRAQLDENEVSVVVL